MFMLVRGPSVTVRCNECNAYVKAEEGFWPPNLVTSLECEECRSLASWDIAYIRGKLSVNLVWERNPQMGDRNDDEPTDDC